MGERRGRRISGVALGAGLALLAGCASERDPRTAPPSAPTPPTTAAATTPTTPSVPPTTAAMTTAAPSSSATMSTTARSRTATTEATTTTTAVPATTTTEARRRRATTTTTEARRRPTTTTSTVPEPLPVHNPDCVVEVAAGDSLSLIADSVRDDAATIEGLQLENGISDRDVINIGDYLDICVGNDVDDVTGEEWTAPPPPPPPAEGTGVHAQQQKLNELFVGHSFPELAVDGDSGRLTEQALCAARVALGLPVSRADMEPGSSEEQALMAAGGLPIPATAPTSSSRWVLIDQTCQVLFAGEGGNRLVFVFPTSTGEPGHETRDQNGSRVFRYDPALENDGWHNSSHYPVPADNPLNGNMYKPLYFDDGQAIHGANYVPTDPQSKGCARLRVGHQDALVDWLGLGGVGGPVWDSGQIDLTVNVQGAY